MTIHKPVLLKETIELLNLKKGMTVVDATLGGGGHSREILKRIGEEGIYIGIDADINAINNFLAEFPISNFQFPNNFQISILKYQNLILANTNFENLNKILEAVEIEKVDAILADLGWSSDQVESEEYGMSFRISAPLDMRYDRHQELTAGKIVNEYEAKDLERILRNYGEEKFARNIVKKIVEYREKKPIETTTELAEIIKKSLPVRFQHGKINPATKTFQALRIEVNGELENIKKFIPQAIDALNPGGRLGIITFHSIEDRIVKNMFRENARGCICPPASLREALRTGPPLEEFIYGRKPEPKVKIINKKPIVPTLGEVSENPRARSAKLRVCEKE